MKEFRLRNSFANFEGRLYLMKKDLEIYIHIPFCVKKCDYCDFFSMTASDEIKELYVKALLREIAAVKVPLNDGVCSIFFGGGTPSILDAKWICEILQGLRLRFTFADDIEISIECNPGTINDEKLLAYREFGINRISFGLQSTNNEELLSLGRIHTYEDFLASYEMARAVGFNNISVDLISGLPHQSLASWSASLKAIGALKPEHISAYSLIVEAGTPFATKKLHLPDEDEERRMYEQTYEILAGFGYDQYEISNYAKSGYQCRHNVGYWQRLNYLGLGVSAASLVDDMRYCNIRDLQGYIKNSHNLERIRCDIEYLSEQDKMEEFVLLGLRKLKGLDDSVFKAAFGVSLGAAYGAKIARLVEQGLLEFAEGYLRLTRKGISVSNYVIAKLLV